MTGAAIGYIELLKRNTQFRNLYFARLISLLGDWFNLIALLALLRAIGAETAMAFGTALIVKSLPTALVSPWAGDVADRFSRKRVMVIADLLRALAVSGLFLVVFFPSPILIYSLIILQAAIAGFFEPARTALLPEIVRPEELTAANALGAATWSAMLTLGMAAGGLFTAYFGWKAALVVDIGTYLLSAVFVLQITEPQMALNAKNKGLKAYNDGLKYLLGNFEVWSMAAVKMGWNFVGAVTLMITVLGETKFAIGEKAILGVSFLYVMRGFGTGVGPIISRALSQSKPRRMEFLIGFSFVWAAAWYNLIPYMSHIIGVGICIFFAHLGGATAWVFSTIRLQQLTPSAFRGRVFATEQAAFLLFFVACNLVYGNGVDAGYFEAGNALAIMGTTLLIPAALWAVRQRVLYKPNRGLKSHH